MSLLISVVFCVSSYRARWLSLSGSITASIFGASLLLFGGFMWIAPVLFFFASSSILSKIGRQGMVSSSLKVDHVRNAGQVLANGGIGWAVLLMHIVFPDPLWFAGFSSAFAAATADTWGTEIGRLSKGKTRSVVSWKVVERGVSGGISWQGTLGGMLGAGAIAVLAYYGSDFISEREVMMIAGAGVMGSLIDSILGATLQVRYQHVSSGHISEEKVLNDAKYKPVKGIPWMTNDIVNLLCTAVGASLGTLLLRIF